MGLHSIFTVSVKSDDDGDSAIWITALLNALEQYVPRDGTIVNEDTVIDGVTVKKKGTPAVGWHVRRLHKWTFKRMLAEEGQGAHGEWVVENMNRWRWHPPKS